MYSWVRRANGTRAGPPGPYICALLRGFCEKVLFLDTHLLQLYMGFAVEGICPDGQ
jgi:hypothetical protein